MRSKDYTDIKNKFRPEHADYTYFKKYGIKDYSGGRSSIESKQSCIGAITKVL